MTDDIIDWSEKHTKLPASDCKPMELTPLHREILRRLKHHNCVIVRQGLGRGFVCGNYRPAQTGSQVPESAPNGMRFWMTRLSGPSRELSTADLLPVSGNLTQS
ncbi:hypothetical protein [Rhodopseudomonas sp. P2A-2r]|uniref:hypothetical protein n=1 Tax=unclassified Rhodopseudomonas TaxID=2638247 RepID=UPI0022349254|nr:hypothetical protein [Rhodopseudomonas sp. P2A-2r]UZE51558.1 hypothetical protein ONR75_13730 [Rhodopseudomonas sp. P2A-2r]